MCPYSILLTCKDKIAIANQQLIDMTWNKHLRIWHIRPFVLAWYIPCPPKIYLLITNIGRLRSTVVDAKYIYKYAEAEGGL
jgi:hypothetical protein